MSYFNLKNKIALVTGSTSGLGLEIAKGLAIQGATVILNGRDKKKLKIAVTSLQKINKNIVSIAFDISNENMIKKCIDKISIKYGRLDILINCVGMRDRRELGKFKTKDFENILKVNLIAPFNLCRYVSRLMIKNKTNGKILR